MSDDELDRELIDIDRLLRNRIWQQLGWDNARVEREIERLDREEDQGDWGEPRHDG